MQTLRNPDRRSFLARVLGGAALVGAGLILGAEAPAESQKNRVRTTRMVVDRDPGDPARLPGAPRPNAPPGPGRPQPIEPPAPPANPTGHHRVQSAAPSTQRFVICPGNRRCPPR